MSIRDSLILSAPFAATPPIGTLLEAVGVSSWVVVVGAVVIVTVSTCWNMRRLRQPHRSNS